MFKFKQKDSEFFDLFVESAQYFYQGALMMDEVMLDYSKAADKVKEVVDLEHAADAVNDKIIDKLNLTFITPIDREDIYALVNKMDSIMDVIEATAVRIYLYKVKRTSDEIIKQAQILNDAIRKLKTIIRAMRNMKNSDMILAGCVEINTLENAGDITLRSIMANLFETEKDAIELVKWKDIFQLLEEAIDVCEDVSNIVEGIVLKHA